MCSVPCVYGYIFQQVDPVLPPALDLNALNDLAATLLGPAATNPAPLQPVQPRPMFRDPRAGPTVPLDMPPELAMELQRLRGGPALLPQQAPVFGDGGGRRRKWDVVGPRA